MNTALNQTAQIWLDFEPLSTESVNLSPVVVDQAVELSLTIPNEERQWQTYLNALALFGFEEWLEERSAEVTLNREHCSILQPALANAIEAVCNLHVNGFNLCLIATGSLSDEDVILPRAVVDLPQFVPDFYVLLEVEEELSSVTVQRFLSHEQLSNRRAKVDLVVEEDWTYLVPLTWFEGDSDQLLLNLCSLEQTAVLSRSDVALRQVERTRALSSIRLELETQLAQLDFKTRQLWQILTWKQGAVVLTTPELLNWVYQVQQLKRSTPNSSGLLTQLRQHLTDIFQLLTQPAVNVGRWLWNELDELAQELSWKLLPTFAANAPVRSPVEEFEAIITQLEQTGVEIPPQARGAYRNLCLAGMPLCLYAVTWPMLSTSTPEWTLLLILGATPGTSLPTGLQLRISDQTGILVEEGVDTQQSDSYFFTSIVGTWEEKFIVSVSLPSGIQETFPPFSFNPEQ